MAANIYIYILVMALHPTGRMAKTSQTTEEGGEDVVEGPGGMAEVGEQEKDTFQPVGRTSTLSQQKA